MTERLFSSKPSNTCSILEKKCTLFSHVTWQFEAAPLFETSKQL